MAKLTERQKVSRIVRALEDELDGDLFLGDADKRVGRFKVVRRGFGSELGRPDAVVWIEVETHVLGLRVSLKVPILVEAEEAGVSAAKEDFVAFFRRDKLKIPMVVVGRDRAPKRERTYEATAEVELSVHQIGFDRIEQPDWEDS